MEIKLSRQQFVTLLKSVYLGDWMVNAIRVPGSYVPERSLSSFCYHSPISLVFVTSWSSIRLCLSFSSKKSTMKSFSPSLMSTMMRSSGTA
jgi:hypothetical protein